MLDLVYRLAVIERHLAEILGCVRAGGTLPAALGEIDLSVLGSDTDLDDNKTQLLAQVFQSNLMLRRM